MSEPEKGDGEPVDLGKHEPAEEAPFDPYRFGAPEHPIPSEFAPPGYTGPTIPTPPVSGPPAGTSGGYPTAPDNPFGNPPGTPYGQQPPYYPGPGPYGYGAPPPPPYHGYPQPRTGNGKAITALVLGIVSILFCWLLFFDVVFVVLALIFGLIALGESRDGRSGGRGLAIAGIACSVVGALLATLVTIVIFRAANECGGLTSTNTQTTEFQNCLRDHIFH